MFSTLIQEIRDFISSDSREFREAMKIASESNPAEWRRYSSIMKANVAYRHEQSGIEVSRELIEGVDYHFASIRNVRLIGGDESIKLFECIDQKSSSRRRDDLRDVQNLAVRLATELEDLDIVNVRQLVGDDAEATYKRYFYDGLNRDYCNRTAKVMRGEYGPFAILTHDDTYYHPRPTLLVLGRNFQEDPVYEHFYDEVAGRVMRRLWDLSKKIPVTS